MQYTQTQLETSQASLKEIKNSLKEEFQEYIQQQTVHQIPNELTIILKELINQNETKRRQLEKQKNQIQQYTFNNETSQQLNPSNEMQELTRQLEIEKSLCQSVQELKKSINCIKKQAHPLQQYQNQLSLQQKQAENESKAAEFELNRIKIITSELQSQMARLKYQRQQYRDYIYDQSVKVQSNIKSEQADFEAQHEIEDKLQQTIIEQKQQINELNQQQIEKMEQSEQQRITIRNYLTITQLYEYCNNEVEKLEVSSIINSSDSESNSIGGEILSDQEDSVITTNNFFQTQVGVLGKSRLKLEVPKKKKKEKKKLTHAQLMKNFQESKQLLSQIKNDMDINIMEQLILNNHSEQTEIQRQLTDQHNLLLEQRDEYVHELQALNDKINQVDDEREMLVKCDQPKTENFHSHILTQKIASTSNENELQILKETDRLTKMESLFFTLHTRALYFLKRICSILANIQQLSDKLDHRVISVYQGALVTVGLLRQSSDLELTNFPNFKRKLKGNNLTLVYCDVHAYQEYCNLIEIVDDQQLTNNFPFLIEICMTKIATETQCIYEQISIICNILRDEVVRLCNYGSLRSFRDLGMIPLMQSTPALFSAPTMKKIVASTPSKKSEDNSSVRKFEKKSVLADEFKFVIEQNEKSANEDDIDEYYYQMKKELETKPSTHATRVNTAQKTVRTLVYDQPQKNPMAQFLRSNYKFSQSLRRIQSQGQFIESQTKNLRQFLEKEQKNVELLSRMNRTGSTQACQQSTGRPRTQEKQGSTVQLPRATTAANHSKPRMQKKVIASIMEKDMKRLRNQVNKLTKIKLN